MIDYVYIMTYAENESVVELKAMEDWRRPSPLLLHARVHKVGGRYDLPGLMECAKQKFEHALLGPLCEDFALVVTEVYQNSEEKTRGLQTLLIDAAVRYWPILRTLMMFEPIVRKFPNFVLDVLDSAAEGGYDRLGV
jgi:hypothetical protein